MSDVSSTVPCSLCGDEVRVVLRAVPDARGEVVRAEGALQLREVRCPKHLSDVKRAMMESEAKARGASPRRADAGLVGTCALCGQKGRVEIYLPAGCTFTIDAGKFRHVTCLAAQPRPGA